MGGQAASEKVLNLRDRELRRRRFLNRTMYAAVLPVSRCYPLRKSVKHRDIHVVSVPVRVYHHRVVHHVPKAVCFQERRDTLEYRAAVDLDGDLLDATPILIPNSG